MHNEAAPCLVPAALGVLLHIITQARVTWPPSPPWYAPLPPPPPSNPFNPPSDCLFRSLCPGADLLKLFNLDVIHTSHLLPLYFTLLIVLVYLDRPMLSPLSLPFSFFPYLCYLDFAFYFLCFVLCYFFFLLL